MQDLFAKRYDCAAGCPVEATLDLIDGKWKAIILYHLLKGTLRFNELRRRLAKITQRMLTRQLRELEEVGLVSRTIFAEVPPRVEYTLTAHGQSLEPSSAPCGFGVTPISLSEAKKRQIRKPLSSEKRRSIDLPSPSARCDDPGVRRRCRLSAFSPQRTEKAVRAIRRKTLKPG
jgi:DNA-binding HxlR family transcriptional regulator